MSVVNYSFFLGLSNIYIESEILKLHLSVNVVE